MAQSRQAPEGAKDGHTPQNAKHVLSPLWGSMLCFTSDPTAYAVGYYLSPLRG